MEFNVITTGIELLGTTIKALKIENSIVDIEREGKRNFGININEPKFEEEEDALFAQLLIDFEIEVFQSEDAICKIWLTLEGAFSSGGNSDEEMFKNLVVVNGAAALIGIARGKIEGISASIFNNGKIVIPFVNVIDYYKSVED